MKKIVTISTVILAVLMCSCSSEQKESATNDDSEINGTAANPKSSANEQTAPSLTPDEVEQQILFIREKYGIIANGMASGAYTSLELEEDVGGGFTTYKRSMEGGNIRFASIKICHDHGCGLSSYYFWDDQLIFKFDELGHWVGNAEKVIENRTYYFNEKEIRCLTRSIQGSSGYDALKVALGKQTQDTLQCSGTFDRESIKEVLALKNNETPNPTQIIKDPQPTIKMESMSFFVGEWKKTAGAYMDQNATLTIGKGDNGYLGKFNNEELNVEFDANLGHLTGQYSGGKFMIRAISIDPAMLSLSDDGQGGHYEPIKNEEYTKVPNTMLGTITGIDETGNYGQWNVQVKGEQGNISFNFETESIDYENLLNAYCRISFKSELDLLVLDIHVNGKSIYEGEQRSDLVEFTGVLKGALNPSGDMPDWVSVTNKSGEVMKFETYISDKEIALNNKEITIRYLVRNDVKVIEAITPF